MQISGILADFSANASELEKKIELLRAQHQIEILKCANRLHEPALSAIQRESIQSQLLSMISDMVRQIVELALTWSIDPGNPYTHRTRIDVLRDRAVAFGLSQWLHHTSQVAPSEDVDAKVRTVILENLLPVLNQAEQRIWRIYRTHVESLMTSPQASVDLREHIYSTRNPSELAAEREGQIQRFCQSHNVSLTAVDEAAAVSKGDRQKWRKGKLNDASVMSKRIEDVLSGKTRLKPRDSSRSRKAGPLR